MYLYIHVCMYVCMCVCMYVCMYICMYVWMHACMLGCKHTCMPACIHVWGKAILQYIDIPYMGKRPQGKTFAVFVFFTQSHLFPQIMALLINNISLQKCYGKGFTANSYFLLKVWKFPPRMFSHIWYCNIYYYNTIQYSLRKYWYIAVHCDTLQCTAMPFALML